MSERDTYLAEFSEHSLIAIDADCFAAELLQPNPKNVLIRRIFDIAQLHHMLVLVATVNRDNRLCYVILCYISLG